MWYLRIAKINFPIVPESVTEERPNRNEKIDLASGKQVNLTKTPGLAKYTMEIRLPRQKWPWAYWKQPKSSPLSTGYHLPETYAKYLRKWKSDKSHVSLMLIRDKASNGTVNVIKQTVTIEELSFNTDAAEGDDMIVSCTFQKWVDYKTKVKKKKKAKAKSVKKTTFKPKKKTYKVKKHDTLKKISKKMYGTQEFASDIYKWNKKVIEKAAKKHKRKSSKKGKYLYKGTKLKLKNIVWYSGVTISTSK